MTEYFSFKAEAKMIFSELGHLAELQEPGQEGQESRGWMNDV